MKAKVSWNVIAVAIFVVHSAVAGEITGATIDSVVVSSGTVAIQTSGGTVVAAQPACATASYSWATPVNTNDTNRMLSLVLTAQTSDQYVRIVGSGTCTYSSNKEDIGAIVLAP